MSLLPGIRHFSKDDKLYLAVLDVMLARGIKQPEKKFKEMKNKPEIVQVTEKGVTRDYVEIRDAHKIIDQFKEPLALTEFDKTLEAIMKVPKPKKES